MYVQLRLVTALGQVNRAARKEEEPNIIALCSCHAKLQCVRPILIRHYLTLQSSSLPSCAARAACQKHEDKMQRSTVPSQQMMTSTIRTPKTRIVDLPNRPLQGTGSKQRVICPVPVFPYRVTILGVHATTLERVAPVSQTDHERRDNT